jgi:hypothetical protein
MALQACHPIPRFARQGASGSRSPAVKLQQRSPAAVAGDGVPHRGAGLLVDLEAAVLQSHAGSIVLCTEADLDLLALAGSGSYFHSGVSCQARRIRSGGSISRTWPQSHSGAILGAFVPAAAHARLEENVGDAALREVMAVLGPPVAEASGEEVERGLPRESGTTTERLTASVVFAIAPPRPGRGPRTPRAHRSRNGPGTRASRRARRDRSGRPGCLPPVQSRAQRPSAP